MGDGAALPAHLQKYSAEAAKAADMVSGFSSLPKLSIRGKQFRLDREGKEVVYPAGQPLEVVILATDPAKGCAKSYFKDAYTSGADALPDCFSSDGKTPDSFVEKPLARSCTECPMNVFGSGTDAAGKQSKGKACADHKNLFVVEASDLNGAILVLRVPPTSLKSLSEYGRKLAKDGVAPQVIVTQLVLLDTEYPQLEFLPSRYLDATEADGSVTRSNSDEVAIALPSKNKLDIPAALSNESAVAAAPELPAPPPAKQVMTAKAAGKSKEDFIATGWSEAQLIEHGYMEYEA